MHSLDNELKKFRYKIILGNIMTTHLTNLNKINRKYKNIKNTDDLYNLSVKVLAELKDVCSEREISFLMMYYGIESKAHTLEKIGEQQNPKLTRERVRQIISIAIRKIDPEYFDIVKDGYLSIKKEQIGVDALSITKNELFKGFSKNIKGLSAILNDCGIKQVAYRKKVYYYSHNDSRTNVVKFIQKINKEERRKKTLANMSKKAKTVTYVPTDVKDWLKKIARTEKINLNPLYEKIINNFISKSPYTFDEFNFAKTKSWKARKGKAEWSQVGIYIDRNLFEEIKVEIQKISDKAKKNVSLMGFISQAFVWYKEQN